MFSPSRPAGTLLCSQNLLREKQERRQPNSKIFSKSDFRCEKVVLPFGFFGKHAMMEKNVFNVSCAVSMPMFLNLPALNLHHY